MKQKLNNKNYLNIYRTKFFIVKQDICIQINSIDDNILFSKDTFIKRNKKRDKNYEKQFKDKTNLDGKRFHVSASIRTYIY